MQIVIDIDEDTYRYMQSRCKYQNKGDKGLSKFEKAGVAIKNGTPLPRRLIDADKFIDSLKGIERLHIDDELRNNILSALYTNILEAESEG